MLESVVTFILSIFLHLQVYEESILKVGINCAKEAAKRNIKRYIELSTGQVYSYDKVGERC